jgi:hypothetical protein
MISSNADVVPLYERLGYMVEPRISMGNTLFNDGVFRTP